MSSRGKRIVTLLWIAAFAIAAIVSAIKGAAFVAVCLLVVAMFCVVIYATVE